ncbi:MAG: 1-phosphofructokinase family hexose kinase [Acidimicrobiia bacterium]|nr:1-phosphofructokinase family hexose kinase [Acidimicrobiia bacterium]
MITTLTPNPSFDRTLSIDRLERGGVMRASMVRVECSGKGVNVARALSRNGHAARAVIPGNTDEAALFVSSLAAEGTGSRTVPIRGSIRACFTLVETDGTTTQINEPGPELSASESEELVSAAIAAAADSKWLVASGSLPPGAPPDLYVRLATALPDADRRLAVDTSGAALDALVGTGCAVVKPNVAELAALIGRGLRTVGDVIDAADKLRRSGWRSVLVSMGWCGAVLVAEDVCYGPAPETDVRNLVGAGDALLAGFISAGGRGTAALAEGLAWARAAVRSMDTLGPAVTDSDRRAVQVTADPAQDWRVGEIA